MNLQSVRQWSVSASASAALMLLSGCSFFFQVDATKESFYQIPDVSLPQAANHCWARLSVKDARAGGFIQTRKIVFSSDPIEQGYYQFASWTEPPTKRFTTVLISALDGTRYYPSVLHITSASDGDLQLNTEILSFYHNTSKNPGTFESKMRFELLDMRSRAPAEGVTIVKTIPVESFDSEGAVKAASEAVQQTIVDLNQWLEQRCSKEPPTVHDSRRPNTASFDPANDGFEETGE
ncbi:MAG: ABC-type transport auxiliary lipoprotein family protein [Bdellovibrionota bacterium]